MPVLEIILMALALSVDAMTVSFSASAAGFTRQPRAVFRLAFHFGLFQFLMPVLGWGLGISLIRLIESVDHWVAFFLLSFVGTRMILEAYRAEPVEFRADPSRGWQLIALSLATSIDALAVGLTLALVNVNIWYVSAVIGLLTGTLCIVVIKIGHFLRQQFSARLEVVSGIVLILIGFKILNEHLQFF